MTVAIPAEQLSFVESLVSTGAYPNQEAVVGAALRLLQRQQDEAIRKQLQPAIDRLDRGEGINIDSDEELKQFFDDLMAEKDD